MAIPVSRTNTAESSAPAVIPPSPRIAPTSAGVHPSPSHPSKFRVSIHAFFKAAQNGQVDHVARFLEAGGDVNHRDRGKWTALMYAAAGQHLAVVQLLVATPGVRLDLRNVNGWAAVHWAVGSRRGKDNTDILEVLVNAVRRRRMGTAVGCVCRVVSVSGD